MLSSALGSFVWLGVLFLAQNTLFYLFPEKAPSLVLIGVLYYALFEGALAGLVAGCWGGLLLDLFSQGSPGFFTISFAASGGLCGIASSKIFEDSWLSEVVLPAISFYGVTLALQILWLTQNGERLGPAVLAGSFLPWPLLTTALCAPWLFNRLRKLSPRRRRRWAPRT